VNTLKTEFPHPGVAMRTNPHGVKIVRLHYSADPGKGDGEKTLVPELGLPLSPWALKQYQGMTKKANYLQEYEIDFAPRWETRLCVTSMRLQSHA